MTARSRGGLGYALLMVMLFLLCMVAVHLTPVDRPQFALFALTIGLLPIINAVFDWLSYGITIWLLWRGHKRGSFWPFLSAFGDLAAAAVLFAALSITLIVVLGTIDAMRPEPLVGIGTLLAGLRAAPGENWWIVAMVASTLVPTLLHLCLAFFSAVTWFRAGLWNWLIDRFDVHRGVEVALPATVAFSVLLIAYPLVPILLTYGAARVIWLYGGSVRDAYVNWLIQFAQWAGYM